MLAGLLVVPRILLLPLTADVTDVVELLIRKLFLRAQALTPAARVVFWATRAWHDLFYLPCVTALIQFPPPVI